MAGDTENILVLIPQQPPFVMVGKLLSVEENITCTSFIIPADNVFVDKGEFLESGLMENIAQTAAAGAGHKSQSESKPVSVGYIGAVKNFEVLFLPKAGDEIITEVAIKEKVFDMTVAEGKVWCDGQLAAQCEMKIFISPAV